MNDLLRLEMWFYKIQNSIKDHKSVSPSRNKEAVQILTRALKNLDDTKEKLDDMTWKSFQSQQ